MISNDKMRDLLTGNGSAVTDESTTGKQVIEYGYDEDAQIDKHLVNKIEIEKIASITEHLDLTILEKRVTHFAVLKIEFDYLESTPRWDYSTLILGGNYLAELFDVTEDTMNDAMVKLYELKIFTFPRYKVDTGCVWKILPPYANYITDNIEKQKKNDMEINIKDITDMQNGVKSSMSYAIDKVSWNKYVANLNIEQQVYVWCRTQIDEIGIYRDVEITSETDFENCNRWQRYITACSMELDEETYDETDEV